MLAEAQRWIQTLIAGTPAFAPHDPSGRRLAALRAMSNLLGVIQKAAGEQPVPAYRLAVPSRRVPAAR